MVETTDSSLLPPTVLSFDDNRLLPSLYGQHEEHLARLEQLLQLSIVSRGNKLLISGLPSNVEIVKVVLNLLYQRLKKGQNVDLAEIEGAVRMVKDKNVTSNGSADNMASGQLLLPDESSEAVIKTIRRHVIPRSPNQVAYVKALRQYPLVFGLGPAGTGKTYLAVAAAVSALINGKIDRIILSRPAVEAGERLGFLPGDLKEKVDPYLRPLYDALYDMLPPEQVERRLTTGDIEIAPLAFMRGRTLSNCFVILDEAQNTTPVQMKMFLTRLGQNAQMVVTGDLSQIDLPGGAISGLADALRILRGVKDIQVIEFTKDDVVRHPLVARIIEAYDRRNPNQIEPSRS
jgi:phosphate starvation-inducible PhoH-like protein